jgi:LEA14-like dessication related protein
MRSLFVLLCVGVSFVLSGCGTAPERRLEAPAVRITALDANTLSLRIVNANTVPLVINQSTHTLYLGDERIGRIDDRSPIGIPPLGSVSQAVALPAALGDTVRVRLSAATGQLRASVESSFELAVAPDDTLTLKTAGGGLVKAAQ